eukprot:Gb_24002 [translate_table: standard]
MRGLLESLFKETEFISDIGWYLYMVDWSAEAKSSIYSMYTLPLPVRSNLDCFNVPGHYLPKVHGAIISRDSKCNSLLSNLIYRTLPDQKAPSILISIKLSWVGGWTDHAWRTHALPMQYVLNFKIPTPEYWCIHVNAGKILKGMDLHRVLDVEKGIGGSIPPMSSHGPVPPAPSPCIGVPYDRHKTQPAKYYGCVSLNLGSGCNASGYASRRCGKNSKVVVMICEKESHLVELSHRLSTASHWNRYFILTGQEAHNDAGPAIVVSYTASGLSAMLSIFCHIEFAVEIPVAGGSFAYLRVELGDLAAFIAAGISAE